MHRLSAAAGLTILLTLISGCEPLMEEDAYYALQVPPEKLYEIDSMNLDEQPTIDPNVREVDEPQAQEIEAVAPVSLEETRVMAMENNLDLKVQLLAPTIAEEALSAEEAKFESVFYANADFIKTDQPGGRVVPIGQNTFFTDIGSSQRETISTDLGVTVPLQTGGNIAFRAGDSRNENLTNPDAPLSPWYENNLSVSISQPLLRNAGRRVNRHSIRIARYARQIADNQAKLEVIRVLAAADRVYWRLYAARRELEVRQQQYELAQAQLERARRLANAGKVPPVEVLRAEAGVSSQLAAIITAENELRDRQREFKRLINRPGLAIETPTILVPETEPDPVHYLFAPENLVVQAMENRWDLLELELQIAQQISTIDFLQNQALPLVTLNYTYNVPGTGPTRDDSIDLLTDLDYANHILGLQLQVPLGNEQRKANLRRALYQRRQQLLGLESREQLIKQEVLNAMDQVEANWQQILAARQNALLLGRLYEAEVRQFEIGMSTSTDVLQAQIDFANAQSREIQALAEYEISLVDLAYATGTVLGSAKVDWEPLRPPIRVE